MKERKNTTCDCTHRKDAHFQGEGFCKLCACTWWHPNIRCIKRRQKRIRGIKRKRKTSSKYLLFVFPVGVALKVAPFVFHAIYT
jgi:hypothetical protein